MNPETRKLIDLTEDELKKLLKEQRKMCADKAIAHEWNQSSEALDILHNVVSNTEKPCLKNVLKQRGKQSSNEKFFDLI